ncbi:MAG: hypothetical protein ACR2QC_12180 [Gammaproteobacteria bacterium]
MKTKINFALFAFFVAVLSAGCSTNVVPKIDADALAYKGQADKVPGRFALYVSVDAVEDVMTLDSHGCSHHIELSGTTRQFMVSTQQTIDNIFEDVEFVNAPLGRSALLREQYDGMIAVEVRSLEIEMDIGGGGFTPWFESEVEIAVDASVDSITGRLFKVDVEGDADAREEIDGFCGQGIAVIEESISEAMKEALHNLAEKIVYSVQLRGVKGAAAR